MKFNKNDKGIYYSYIYYPKKHPEHNEEISSSILRFKNGYEKDIIKFTNDIKKCILNEININKLKKEEIAIAVVPSHRKGNWGSGLLQLSKIISLELEIYNYSKILIRIQEHEKLSTGGDRSKQSQLDTIKVDSNYNISNKKILLIDDITTTGTSLNTCREILENVGAKKVTCIAIAQTVK